MSQLGWIHFSQSFRDRVNTILELMDEEGTVDELGIGVYRDGFADLFFPGISTIQTRAKYFFIVPYIIKDFLRNGNQKKPKLADYLYNEEHEVMWKLGALYDFDRTRNSGVIGITKTPGKRISRRPSSIYWNGLKRLGFIDTNLSLAEFCLRIDQTTKQRVERTIADIKKNLADDFDVQLTGDKSIKISTYQLSWRQNLDLPLTWEEANFLSQKIKDLCEDSLLGLIMSNQTIQRKFLKHKTFSDFVENTIDDIPSDILRRQLKLADYLSKIAYGLHLVYSNEINLQFYKEDVFRDEFERWKDELVNSIDINFLEAESIIQHATGASETTKSFLRNVFYQFKSQDLTYDKLAALIRKQEQDIKRRKSRFRPGTSADFQKGDNKSLASLNYRFSNAQRIVSDIKSGLDA